MKNIYFGFHKQTMGSILKLFWHNQNLCDLTPRYGEKLIFHASIGALFRKGPQLKFWTKFLILAQYVAGLFRCFLGSKNTPTIRSRTNRLLASVWYKTGTFQMVVVSMKGPPLPCDLKPSILLLRAFKWGTVCKFTSKGVQTARS